MIDLTDIDTSIITNNQNKRVKAGFSVANLFIQSQIGTIDINFEFGIEINRFQIKKVVSAIM